MCDWCVDRYIRRIVCGNVDLYGMLDVDLTTRKITTKGNSRFWRRRFLRPWQKSYTKKKQTKKTNGRHVVIILSGWVLRVVCLRCYTLIHYFALHIDYITLSHHTPQNLIYFSLLYSSYIYLTFINGKPVCCDIWLCAVEKNKTKKHTMIIYFDVCVTQMSQNVTHWRRNVTKRHYIVLVLKWFINCLWTI